MKRRRRVCPRVCELNEGICIGSAGRVPTVCALAYISQTESDGLGIWHACASADGLTNRRAKAQTVLKVHAVAHQCGILWVSCLPKA
jgi:hypothetical protein